METGTRFQSEVGPPQSKEECSESGSPPQRAAAPEGNLPPVLEPSQPFEPEMVLIPAGEFLMGSDSGKDEYAQDNEQPQHRLSLPDYYLARTPVTNAQYVAFVEATGHKSPEHWKAGRIPQGRETHPVVNVSWRDALAYVRWLSEVTGGPYALPSEAEWEKGARGTDGYIYPWGNQWDPKRCNAKKAGLGSTTPVGAYLEGASPYGLLDMAGNALEWTRSLLKGYLYQADDGREDLARAGWRVVRGGSWDYDLRLARCAYRHHRHPLSKLNHIGFRVAASPAL